MSDSGTVVGLSGTAFEAVLAVTQVNEIFQMVQIILAIISFVVTISYTVWRWHKKATREDSDGGKEITPKEVGELFDEIKKQSQDKEEDEHGN